jgi:hypothetical protein
MVERETKRKKSKKRAPKVSPIELVVEGVAVGLLRDHPKNYRKHPQDQITHIKSSIRAHGFYRNVVAAKDGTILAGHGVVIAARELNLDTVPLIRLPIEPDSTLALKVLTGDNEIAKLGDIDDRALTEILKSISDSPDGLEGTGYDKQMLAALVMVTRPAGEIENFDAAAEWVGMPEFGARDSQFKIAILFRNKRDRDRYVKESALEISSRRSPTK